MVHEVGRNQARRTLNSEGRMELGGVGGERSPINWERVTISGVGLGGTNLDRHQNVVRGGFGAKGQTGSLLSSGSINSFLSNIVHKGNYLHKHTYQLDIIAPQGLTVEPDLSIRCESITLPGTNVETSRDNLRKGPSREHAFNMNFGPVSGVFLVDKDQKERTFFHEWQKLCVANQDDGWGVGYYDSYATEMTITQFDMTGKPSFICKLFECFPKSIGPETLTLADTELMRVSVEFVFHRWEQI